MISPDTSRLLPPNSTALERGLAGVMASRMEGIDLPVRDLWSAERCPEHLLPWLAWALSVDVWDERWTEAQKRAAIEASFFIHRHKGTIAGVRRALAAVDIGLDIVEWWQDASPPYTFRITAFADAIFDAGLGIDDELLALIAAQIDTVKPARAHYTLEVGERFTSPVAIRSGTRVRRRDRRVLALDAERLAA
ncbi:MAG: phage tail protein I [Pacificimonas sp.]|jgi:phage tail P2-like protein|nr:phage tail protein I [Pacificimonas sp.]